MTAIFVATRGNVTDPVTSIGGQIALIVVTADFVWLALEVAALDGVANEPVTRRAMAVKGSVLKIQDVRMGIRRDVCKLTRFCSRPAGIHHSGCSWDIHRREVCNKNIQLASCIRHPL